MLNFKNPNSIFRLDEHITIVRNSANVEGYVIEFMNGAVALRKYKEKMKVLCVIVKEPDKCSINDLTEIVSKYTVKDPVFIREDVACFFLASWNGGLPVDYINDQIFSIYD